MSVESIATKLIRTFEAPENRCLDVTLPSDLDGYVPGKLCEYCWTENVNGQCPNECMEPPMCDKCGRRHE